MKQPSNTGIITNRKAFNASTNEHKMKNIDCFIGASFFYSAFSADLPKMNLILFLLGIVAKVVDFKKSKLVQSFLVYFSVKGQTLQIVSLHELKINVNSEFLLTLSNVELRILLSFNFNGSMVSTKQSKNSNGCFSHLIGEYPG